MEEELMVIEADRAGERVDRFLAEEYPFSRAYFQKLLQDGMVRVNEKAVKANYKLKANDVLELSMLEPEGLKVEPKEMALDIVYEDHEVLVVNKPRGLVVHPAHGHFDDTLVNGLLAHCTDLSGINGVLRPGIVHRIDRDTSGLLMVAKTDQAHQSLAEQLRVHSVERAYYALVHGNIAEPAGLVDAPIGRHGTERKKMAVVPGGKEARTHYRVKERFGEYTLIECRLETGRTHQIRVHMAYLGHPLVGDPLYGYRKNNLGFVGQALHAYLLGFVHPVSGERLRFTAPLPEDFAAVLDRLRKDR